MSSAPTITTNLPFGLFSAASLSGPMPTLSKNSAAIFNIDDAGQANTIEELDAADANEKLFWED